LTKIGVTEHPKINVINVFINEDVTIDVPEYPEAIMTAEKLKDFIRKTAKQVNLEPSEIDKLTTKLPIE
jgi:hypothetical protein